MKKCKLYRTTKNIELDAVIIDNKVLVPVTENGETRYLPPAKAIDLSGDFVFLLPFSVECKWGEFGECTKLYAYGDYDEDDPRPGWAIDCEIDDVVEKWGYCVASSGEIKIPPQWIYCEDFAGDFACVKGNSCFITDANSCLIPMFGFELQDIKISPMEDVFFVQSHSGHWGAVYPNDWFHDHPGVNLEWDGIWWDGSGGFVVMRKDPKGNVEYLIVNANVNTGGDILIGNLTEKPVRYDCGRINSYRDYYEGHDYCIIYSNARFGLIRDLSDMSSSVILSPEHSYEDVLEAAYQAELEREIRYYANVIVAAGGLASRYADCWETVPGDIRDEVWKQAKLQGED